MGHYLSESFADFATKAGISEDSNPLDPATGAPPHAAPAFTTIAPIAIPFIHGVVHVIPPAPASSEDGGSRPVASDSTSYPQVSSAGAGYLTVPHQTDASTGVFGGAHMSIEAPEPAPEPMEAGALSEAELKEAIRELLLEHPALLKPSGPIQSDRNQAWPNRVITEPASAETIRMHVRIWRPNRPARSLRAMVHREAWESGNVAPTRVAEELERSAENLPAILIM